MLCAQQRKGLPKSAKEVIFKKMVLKRTLLALGIVSAMIVGGLLWSMPANAATSALSHGEALIVSRDDCTDANGINFKKCALMTNYINPAIKLLAGVAAIASSS